MIALSRRQSDLLDFLRSYVAKNGFAPSFEELKAFLGAGSKSRVFCLLTGLEDKGYIRRLPRRARAIEIVPTRDYHAADCPCDACASARYSEQVKLIQAVQNFPPPRILCASKSNFRIPSREGRASLNAPHLRSGKRVRTESPAEARQ